MHEARYMINTPMIQNTTEFTELIFSESAGMFSTFNMRELTRVQISLRNVLLLGLRACHNEPHSKIRQLV